MNAQPRFVNEDDYENYTGEKLSSILKVKNNTSNATNLFIMRIEDSMLARIDSETFRTNAWDNLTTFQKESLQKAIIYQIEYILRNGDIFTDSGYDPERGEVISLEKLRRISICPTSWDLLQNCGLFNKSIKNRLRVLNLLR